MNDLRHILILSVFPSCLLAQITVDRPIRLVGNDMDRGIDGLAPPTGESSMITIGTAALGIPHWADAGSFNSDTLPLTTAVEASAYREGMFLRFMAGSDHSGAIFLRLNAAEPTPLLRSDGLHPRKGQLRSGAICEVVLNDGVFILLAPDLVGCPVHTLAVNDRLCVDSMDVPGLNFHQAQQHCARVGGRLCSWDEYIGACQILQSQLSGMFNGWEWIDDTSDHSQTADRAGSSSCTSQSSIGPFTLGDTRCCYRIP